MMADARPPLSVRLATTPDRVAMADMLARAFADDPAFAYVFPDRDVRLRLLPRVFRLLFDSDGRAGLRLVAGDADAASLWRAPGRAHVGVGEMLRHAAPLLLAFRGATRRALRLGDAIAAHHPTGDYWYLHLLATDPASQRRGRGAAVVRAGLDRVAGRLPCYLETANADNLAFYSRLGFETTGEWRVPGHGPLFWSMLRPAG